MRSDSPTGAVSCCAAQVTVGAKSLSRAIAYLKKNKNTGLKNNTEVKVFHVHEEILAFILKSSSSTQSDSITYVYLVYSLSA